MVVGQNIDICIETAKRKATASIRLDYPSAMRALPSRYAVPGALVVGALMILCSIWMMDWRWLATALLLAVTVAMVRWWLSTEPVETAFRPEHPLISDDDDDDTLPDRRPDDEDPFAQDDDDEQDHFGQAPQPAR